MKILLTTVAAAVIAAGASAAYAQDNSQNESPQDQHRGHHHGMRWNHQRHFMPHPMGTVIDVEKKADGYKVQVVCSPKTAADDCMTITNKLLDRFPTAK